jgi:hypothetical protein
MAFKPGFGLAAIEMGQHDADNAGYPDDETDEIENVNDLQIGLAGLEPAVGLARFRGLVVIAHFALLVLSRSAFPRGCNYITFRPSCVPG